MATQKPKKLVVEDNSAVVGKFPRVVFVNPADDQKYQCRWVRTTTGMWNGCEFEADADGYVAVSPSEVRMGRFSANEGTAIRFAEYILMKCDKKEYDERQLANQKHAIALQQRPEQQLQQAGVTTRVIPMSGQQLA